jgi:hypothetical protein
LWATYLWIYAAKAEKHGNRGRKPEFVSKLLAKTAYIRGVLPQNESIVSLLLFLIWNCCLNTHKPASLYEAFPPAEAKRILSRLEFHYTPKHGSWLNMAEIELNVLANQCLDRRTGPKERLISEIQAWQVQRNRKAASTDWRFTTEDARIKLKHLYPSLDT